MKSNDDIFSKNTGKKPEEYSESFEGKDEMKNKINDFYDESISIDHQDTNIQLKSKKKKNIKKNNVYMNNEDLEKNKMKILKSNKDKDFIHNLYISNENQRIKNYIFMKVSAFNFFITNFLNRNIFINTWNSNDLQNEIHDSVEVGGVIGSTLSDTGKLAAAGSMFGPVGTIVGGAAGLLSGLGRGLISAFQHNNAEEELNNAIKRANIEQTDNFYTTAQNNQQRQQRQAMMNYFDNGGSLDELNGVTEFNVGDTHENNPYGGIQQGIASDNLPNMVEEGEVKWNDYIFSARNIPSESLLKKYKLI
jgi:hypothetical protein